MQNFEKITIKDLKSYDRDRDGKPYISKFEKPYKRLTITATDGRIFSMSDWNNLSANWKIGTEITGKVSSREYNGKTYLQFDVPNVKTAFGERLDRITKLTEKVYLQVKGVAYNPLLTDSGMERVEAMLKSIVGEDMGETVKDNDTDLPF